MAVLTSNNFYAYNGSVLNLYTGLLNTSLLNGGSPVGTATLQDPNGLLSQTDDTGATFTLGGVTGPVEFLGSGTIGTFSILGIQIDSRPVSAFSVNGQIYLYAPNGLPLLSAISIDFNINPNGTLTLPVTPDGQVDGLDSSQHMALGFTDAQGDKITTGSDLVYGNDGNDTVDAGLGNDTVEGGNGNDSLIGNAGNDTLVGQAGDDRFVNAANDGADRFVGGETSETTGDTLDSTGVSSNVTVTYTGAEAGTISQGTGPVTGTTVPAGAPAGTHLQFFMLDRAAWNDPSNMLRSDTNSGAAGAGATITLNGYTGATVSVDSTIIKDGSSADLTAPVTINGETFGIGAHVELDYGFVLRDAAGIQYFVGKVDLGTGGSLYEGSVITAGWNPATSQWVAPPAPGAVLTLMSNNSTFAPWYTSSSNSIASSDLDPYSNDVELGVGINGPLVISGSSTTVDTFEEMESLLLGAGNDSVNGFADKVGIDVNAGAGNDTVTGGAGNDTLEGGTGNDKISGLQGNDSITGDDGADTLIGGGASDTISGGSGDDRIFGGSEGGTPASLSLYGIGSIGNLFRLDVNEAGDATRTLIGNTGIVFGDIAMGPDGTLYGATMANPSILYRIDPTTAQPTLVGAIGASVGGNSLSFGTDGKLYGADFATVYRIDPLNPSNVQQFWTNPEGGRPAGDFLIVGDKMYVAWLTPSNTTTLLELTLNGTGGVAAAETLGVLPANTFGLALGDEGQIYAAANSSFFLLDVPTAPLGGGAGTVPATVVPGSTISGQYFGATSNFEPALGDGVDAGDSLSGGTGNDSVFGGDGSDSIDGGAGNDSLIYGSGNDSVFGGDGDDLIDDLAGSYLPTGNNLIFGGAGNDTIWDSGQSDTIFGGSGNDSIEMDAGGNDAVDGGEGNDTLRGNAGDDTLIGGAGADLIEGGAGNDLITFTAPQTDGAGDTVRGGTGATDSDVLDLRGAGMVTISQQTDPNTRRSGRSLHRPVRWSSRW